MREPAVQRALGIDPTTRGFAFALIEGECVLDRGERIVAARGKNRRCAEALVKMIRRRQPDVLVLEDCAACGSRRCARVRRLIGSFRSVASELGIPARLVSPRRLREIFAGNARATKHQVAIALGERFPELRIHVPPQRKPWMTEHPRANVFDAIALAAAHSGTRQRVDAGSRPRD